MRALIVAASLLLATAAAAQEPVGCDKFKWPVEKEKAALDGAKPETVAAVTTLPLKAKLALASVADAKLPKSPERPPKPASFAGSINITGVSAGVYSIALSEQAWLDVIQRDRFLKPMAFSGVHGCEGIRKVVRFELTADPVVIQVSNSAAAFISIAILPVE